MTNTELLRANRRIEMDSTDQDINSIVGMCTFIGYATQRDNGMSVESCKRIGFNNVDFMEELYQSPSKQQLLMAQTGAVQ